MAIYRFRKEELEGQLNRNALWAIVYGDMMSYLMILFLLLFSWSLSKKTVKKDPVEESLYKIQRVFGGTIDPKIEERSQQRDKEMLLEQMLKKRVDDGDLGEAASLIVTEKRIAVNLGEGVLFESGKAQLKPGAAPILEAIVGDMLSLKNHIRVEGHTDSLPIRKGPFESNFELSMARANTVIKKLMALKVNPGRLSGVGYGEHRPIAENRTPAGRAKNRRIEISLLREE